MTRTKPAFELELTRVIDAPRPRVYEVLDNCPRSISANGDER